MSFLFLPRVDRYYSVDIIDIIVIVYSDSIIDIIMEVISDRFDNQTPCERDQKSSETNPRKKENEICEVSSNWQINNAKQFIDTISIASPSKTPKRYISFTNF